jgi:outer membrane protein
MKRASLTLVVLLLASLAGTVAAQAANDRPVLELTLDEVVERALKNNLDIAVQRYDPELAEADILDARGAYDPLLSGEFRKSSSTIPGTDRLSGGDKVVNDSLVYNLHAAKLFGTGGSARVDFANTKSDTNNSNAFLNPSFSSGLTASLAQPVLRNFHIDASRQRLRVVKINREISDVQFHELVVNIVALAKKQYYDISFATDNLEAQRKSMSLAGKLLDENQIKVRVGTLAPLDVVAAEAEVASREEAVIQAEALLQQVEDNLKKTILPANDPIIWSSRIVTRERPGAVPPSIDLEAAIRNALEKRTDIQAARKNVEANDITLQYARNQLLPVADVVASYGANAARGTQIRDSQGNLLAQPIAGGYGDALSDVFGRNFPTWSVGVNVAVPLFNRVARGNAARSRLTKEQAETSLRRLELNVAADVRIAARNLDTGYKRVEATRAARTLSERRLDAEQKRFDAGMSTNFFVTQAQRDLAVAQVNELSAIADYNKSLVDFDRVQEAGGGVSFATN